VSGDLPGGVTQSMIDDEINPDPDGPPASEPGECRSAWCSQPICEQSDYLCSRHKAMQRVVRVSLGFGV